MLEPQARVLKHTETFVRFKVDPVHKSKLHLPTRTLKKHLEEQLKTPLLVCSHAGDTRVVRAGGHHPMIEAVHAAFSQHLPLKITPDAFWLTLSEGFALHINNHAELLRDFFVTHQGRQTLRVHAPKLDTLADWERAVENWSSKITQHVGEETSRLFTCDFSTSTLHSRTASQVVMMGAMQHYFGYELCTICGIPQVTLQGTAEDWENIKRRVEQLAYFDLEWWTVHLLPICDALIETAKGAPPLHFWQNIYRPWEDCGNRQIAGWLKCLFPYVKGFSSAAFDRQNPCLQDAFLGFTGGESLSPESAPGGWSTVPFQLLHGEIRQNLLLVGGLLGVQQSQEDQCVESLVGWGVTAQR